MNPLLEYAEFEFDLVTNFSGFSEVTYVEDIANLTGLSEEEVHDALEDFRCVPEEYFDPSNNVPYNVINVYYD